MVFYVSNEAYPSRPIIYYYGKPLSGVYIIKGKAMSLVCSSIGEPSPTITWKTSSNELISNSVLSSPNVQMTHNGSYSCSAWSILSPSNGQEITVTNTSYITVNVLCMYFNCYTVPCVIFS